MRRAASGSQRRRGTVDLRESSRWRKAGGPVALAASALLFACGDGAERTAELYQQHCANCHGSDGRGDPRRTPLEPNLDLTRSELVTSGSRGAVYRAISSGFNTMPGYAHKLAHADIDALTQLVMDFDTTQD